MSSRTRGARIREPWLREHLADLATSLGYTRVADLAGVVGRAHLVISFVRTGRRLLTEALTFGVRWVPVSEMVVDLLGSPLSLDRLLEVGVFTDDAVRISLCQYQLAFTSLLPEKLWKEVVRLPPQDDWTRILEKLRSTLTEIQPDLEDNMWRLLEQIRRERAGLR